MLPVVILAGGLATRLRPITEHIPKALVQINGEPFLAHQLRLLRRNGIQRVVLSVAYKGEMIQDFAGNGSAYGLHIDYVFDGPTYLGTGGAIRNALAYLGESFLTLCPATFPRCSRHSMLAACRP
ncbi:MAG: NTP transferase domain-containing protein [Acidobacteria bacterium]|nr:NTP transferase domain-containing protein [Acidobacteriota bacterium]